LTKKNKELPHNVPLIPHVKKPVGFGKDNHREKEKRTSHERAKGINADVGKKRVKGREREKRTN